MSMTLIHTVGHISFILTALSFYVRDILMLRALAIVSGIFGVFYSFNITVEPLWLTIFWLCVFMSINGVRIFNILMERRGISFTEEERELFGTIFRQFAPVEFMKIMRIATWKSAQPEEILATQGEEMDDVKLIFNGEVAIERDGEQIAHSRDGAFIGEMSFIKGGAATATVKTLRLTRYVVWPKTYLESLLKRNPTMDLAMKAVFSMDMVKKLGRDESEEG
jgi:hypothetical protein|tara:strand:+ start:212 stop:877 length:666 start_codon:yes stop_codon:yes gene_type:complete